MKKTWIVIAMLAALSCACDDDKDDSNACVNGVKICSADGVRQECVNGAYIDIPCEKGSICSDGLCSPSTENCSSSSVLPYTGADGRSITYCVNSRIVTEPCPDGFTVAIGSYGAYCKAPESSATTDSKACSTNGAQRCSAAGVHQVCNGAEWVDQPCTTDPNEAAAWKCEAGECVHYTICFEGQTTCDGKTAMKCVKGARENMWQKSRDCGAEGTTCSAGRCVNDEYYDCSNEPYDGKTLAESFCNSSKPVALCVTCDSQHLWCYPKEDADARIGKSAASVGDARCSGNTNPEPGGEDAKCDAYDCTNDPYQGGGTVGQACKSQFERDTALCLRDPQTGSIQPVCLNRDAASDNQCSDGKKAYSDDEGGYCVLVGDDKSCLNGGGSSSGATCDVFDCGEGYTDQSTGKSLKETCALDGFSVALCGYDEAGDIGYMCANPATGSCESGSAYTNESGETGCLVVGTDKSCLDGSSSGGSSSGGGDDTIYDCSSEIYQGKTLAEGFCTSEKPVALCVPCDEESLWCVSSADASQLIGEAGSDYFEDMNCSGGSSSGSYRLCPSDCTIKSSGQSCIESCKAKDSASTCLVDPDNYIECALSCNAADVNKTTPGCVAGNGAAYKFNYVCSAVESGHYYIMDVSSASQCSSSACNADNTACK